MLIKCLFGLILDKKKKHCYTYTKKKLFKQEQETTIWTSAYASPIHARSLGTVVRISSRIKAFFAFYAHEYHRWCSKKKRPITQSALPRISTRWTPWKTVTSSSGKAATDTHAIRGRPGSRVGTRGPHSGPRTRVPAKGTATARSRPRKRAVGVAPWRGPAVGRLGSVVEAMLGSHASTLAASTSGCSSGSCSPGNSLIFSHFDNESVLWFYAHRWISWRDSRPYAGGSLSFASDPNLMINICFRAVLGILF